MFTKMQKYHKAFLITITVVITASFGMGTVILSLARKNNIAEIAVLAGKKITVADFQNTEIEWSKIYKLAIAISPKVERIRKAPQIAQQIGRMGSSRMPGMLEYSSEFTTANPVWDTIFSLREDVAKLDHRLYEQAVNNPVKSKRLLSGDLSLLDEELDIYAGLPREKIDKLINGRLTKKDVWNLLLLETRGKDAGIEVTGEEIDSFISETIKALGGKDRYLQILENEKIVKSNMPLLAKRALTVVKYLRARSGGIQVSMQTAYETYAKLHVKYRMYWVRFHRDWKSIDEEQYRKHRLAFYDEKQKSDPNYFELAPKADFDYVYLQADSFIDRVKVSPQEVEKAYKEKLEKGEKTSGDEETEKNLILQQLKREKAPEQAKAFLADLQEKLGAAGKNAPLKDLAKEENMTYEYFQDVSKEKFSEQAYKSQIATDQVKQYIYEKLEPNTLTPVLTENKRGVFFVRLRRRVPARQLSREDVGKDDSMFLKCYYQNSTKPADFPDRYRIGYVVMDYNALKQNMLITTPVMKEQFYQKYKEQLYRLSDGKCRDFEEVKDDVEKRVAHYMGIREMQNFNLIYEKCKNPGKKHETILFSAPARFAAELSLGRIPSDLLMEFYKNGQFITQNAMAMKVPDEENKWAIYDQVQNQLKLYYAKKERGMLNIYSEETEDVDLSIIVDELKKGMLVPESLKYIETPLLTAEALAQNNPTGNPDFVPDTTLSGLSQVMDSANGKYFYKVLEKKVFNPGREFTELQEEAKEHFLKKRMMEQAKADAQAFAKEYAGLLEKAQKKQQEKREKDLPYELFRALAYQFKLDRHTTSYFENFYQVPELRDATELVLSIHSLEPGQISKPVEEKGRNSVLITQLIERKRPAPGEVPQVVLERIQKILWNQQYRVELMSLVNYQREKESMNLKVTDLDYEDFLPRKHRRRSRLK